MKRFNKVYLEISNVCNLKCQFCPGTKRKPKVMTEAEFSSLLPRLRPYADYLYFHLMGEPLCHPQLERFLELAGGAGFKVILTTNGTLLEKNQETLLRSPALHKVNISLHAFEANDLTIPFSRYLQDCFRFGKAAEGNKLIGASVLHVLKLNVYNRAQARAAIINGKLFAKPRVKYFALKGRFVASRYRIEDYIKGCGIKRFVKFVAKIAEDEP